MLFVDEKTKGAVSIQKLTNTVWNVSISPCLRKMYKYQKQYTFDQLLTRILKFSIFDATPLAFDAPLAVLSLAPSFLGPDDSNRLRLGSWDGDKYVTMDSTAGCAK